MSDRRANSSLFGALKGIAATLLATGRTRLELLGNEIEEEKLHAIHLLLIAQGLVFCFGVSAVLAIGLFTTLFWDNRLYVLSLSSVLFLVLGLSFYTLFKRAVHRPERAFAASIAELQEDLRQLKAATGHESAAK